MFPRIFGIVLRIIGLIFLPVYSLLLVFVYFIVIGPTKLFVGKMEQLSGSKMPGWVVAQKEGTHYQQF